jgi:hypothetical protein
MKSSFLICGLRDDWLDGAFRLIRPITISRVPEKVDVKKIFFRTPNKPYR